MSLASTTPVLKAPSLSSLFSVLIYSHLKIEIDQADRKSEASRNFVGTFSAICGKDHLVSLPVL